jgi:hypothetical protein
MKGLVDPENMVIGIQVEKTACKRHLLHMPLKTPIQEVV